MSLDVDQQLSRLGRRGAASLHWVARSGLGLAGIVAVAGAGFLLIPDPARETGGTALLIIGSVFILLAVIGRLPKSLEVAGMALEYEQDEMADFISTLRGTDLDDDTIDALLNRLQQMSASSRVFKNAKKQADETSKQGDAAEWQGAASAAPSAVESPGHGKGERGRGAEQRPRIDDEPRRDQDELRNVEDESRVSNDEPLWIEALKTADVAREHPVVQPSGRGRPPRVDFYVQLPGGVVIGENLQAWNPTSLKLLEQRLRRVFGNDRSVQLAIVTVPQGGYSALTGWYRSLDDDLRSRIVVASDSREGATEINRRLLPFERKRE